MVPVNFGRLTAPGAEHGAKANRERQSDLTGNDGLTVVSQSWAAMGQMAQG